MRYYSPKLNYINKFKSNTVSERKGISPSDGISDEALSTILKKQLYDHKKEKLREEKEKLREEKEEKKNKFSGVKRKRIDNDLLDFLQK